MQKMLMITLVLVKTQGMFLLSFLVTMSSTPCMCTSIEVHTRLANYKILRMVYHLSDQGQ